MHRSLASGKGNHDYGQRKGVLGSKESWSPAIISGLIHLTGKAFILMGF
jgi:hypothetical protein